MHVYDKTTFGGKPYIRCQNSILESKYSRGEICNVWVDISGNPNVIAKLCKRCTALIAEWPEAASRKKPAVTKPKGWVKMKEYVDPEGNVYFRGVLQPELKGTKNPTVIVPKPAKSKKVKLRKKQKSTLRNALLCELHDIRNRLASGEEIDFAVQMKLDKRRLEIEKELDSLK